jgi:hypothetical protein
MQLMISAHEEKTVCETPAKGWSKLQELTRPGVTAQSPSLLPFREAARRHHRRPWGQPLYIATRAFDSAIEIRKSSLASLASSTATLHRSLISVVD